MGTQRWWPDTCECCLEMDVNPVDGTWSNITIVSACPRHKDHPDPKTAAQEDNRRKNTAIGEVVEKGYADKPENVAWRATDDVGGVTLTLPDKSSVGAAQSAVDAKFGAGKIKIE